MDMGKIARILIDNSNNKSGGIPILIDIDGDDKLLDLRKMNNILVVGENKNISIDNILSNIKNISIISIDNSLDLQRVYDEYKTTEKYIPEQIVIIRDISTFKDKYDIMHLKEMLNHGHSCGLFFVCGCRTNTIIDEYDIAIPVIIYEDATYLSNDVSSLFSIVGTCKHI